MTTAVLLEARAAHARGATHDCGEWAVDDVCQVCGAELEPEIVATFYVVYFNPADYRGQHVIRRQIVVRGEPQPRVEMRLWFEGLVGGSLAAARASLPAGLTCLPRQPNDDPSIVEAWMV